MDATAWAVVAFAVLGLRLLGVIAVGAGWVPAWSGPVVEVLLWVGGPAVVDPHALDEVASWLGLVLLLLLWAPAVALGRRSPGRRRTRASLVVAATLALAVQAAVAQHLVAGTVSEATDGRVCQLPRKIVNIGGDLFPAPPGTVETRCVLGRPGGGYLGD